eukprot:NODE_1805_length_752_cov_111.834993_g1403_i0.p2 GENE.NODE_1805_length_752_cov_111.834993_g1403_i0~~NODE_1805_length_752_cov_111.834993_g1403_i0.p2  ORF type:complete len:180 (-),score=45.03 NODE_1805_length_752_cov_111.834993_g1403_i0:117-656(-)
MSLHAACTEGQHKRVRNLVEKGADVNALDAAGNTPIICAAEEGRLNVVKLLLELKADTSHTTPDGRTAQSVAAVQPNGAAIIRCLKAAAANPAASATTAFAPTVETSTPTSATTASAASVAAPPFKTVETVQTAGTVESEPDHWFAKVTLLLITTAITCFCSYQVTDALTTLHWTLPED